MMTSATEMCNDDRFELIGKAKAKLLERTNIDSRPEEISVLDSILFRCWQMGWLDQLHDEADTLGSVTSSSEAANPQIRCTDSKRNAPVRDGEDSHTLLPCPFCGSEAQIHYDANGSKWVACENRECAIQPYLYRTKRTEAEAVEAWNTRACGQCEGGAVPMTEENMAEHGWVRERTCRPSGEWKSISQTQEVRHVTCSECGHEFGMERRYTIPFERTLLVELPNFCPNCGAEVMDA